jgi:uncharacterized repeat protein (TIGR03803 family)
MLVMRSALAPARSRKQCIPGKLGLARVACMIFVLCAATAITATAQTFTALLSFDGSDGCIPFAGLVQATNGNLYGTTNSCGANGYGTVFKITPSGTLTTLHSFDGTDGGIPYAGLLQDTNGNLYGTTSEGGVVGGGDGTVFQITPSGTLMTLSSFDFTNGASPYAGLLQGTNGKLYGTTWQGGSGNLDSCSFDGCGTVFETTLSGATSTLYSFCVQSGCPDGSGPQAGLVQATNGSLYGTTTAGGTNGYGTIFKITPSGTLTTLYSFCSQSSCPDGKTPYAELIQATNGNLYGTTYYGGTNGYGTIFRITPSGTLTTLHSFDYTDGAYPYAGLNQASDGNFYGTTVEGGTSGFGTVFKITPSGTLTTLHSFDYTDGADVQGGLFQGTNGTFYGTTEIGGSQGLGTVFSLSVGLGPFVETLPTSGKVGAAVKILGTNLAGATSVTFNSTAATFTVVSSTEIKTTVPTGATSGTVKVTTSSGNTLDSNIKFRVTP